VCVSWQQCFEESLECYTRAAELYGEVEHLSPAGILRLGRVRASMGLVHERMGAMEAALMQYEQALEIYEEHLGSWHTRVGGVLVAMAGGYQRLGRRKEGMRLYLRALAVFTRALGPEHLVLAEVYNHIGSHLAQASQRSSYLKAISWYYAALLLLMRSRTEQVEHRLKLASQYRRIGQMFKQQGRLRVALGWCVRAMDVRMELLGARHCAMSCYVVAQLHFQLSNFDAALPLYFQAVECHARAAHGGRVRGETIDVAAAFSEMALIYEAKGQYDRAWELALRAADRGRPSSLPKHAEASRHTQVDKMIRKIQDRLRARRRFNNVLSTLRHGVRDWDPLWVPDKDAPACNVCSARFSLLRRRHHCRMCGQVVCAACSSHPRGKRICSACRDGGDGSALARRCTASVHGPSEADALDALDDLSRRLADGEDSLHAGASLLPPSLPPLGASDAHSHAARAWEGRGAGAGGSGGAGGVRGEGGEETVRQWLTALSAASDAQHAPTLTIPDFTAEHYVA
jgi:tetratricopeptide (TPR) repeat protein